MINQKITHFSQSNNVNRPDPGPRLRRTLLSYLNAHEVADELGVSESYVLDLIHNKIKEKPRLAAFKVGRRWYVSVFSLVHWATKNEGHSDERAIAEADRATRNRKPVTQAILTPAK